MAHRTTTSSITKPSDLPANDSASPKRQIRAVDGGPCMSPEGAGRRHVDRKRQLGKLIRSLSVVYDDIDNAISRRSVGSLRRAAYVRPSIVSKTHGTTTDRMHHVGHAAAKQGSHASDKKWELLILKLHPLVRGLVVRTVS